MASKLTAAFCAFLVVVCLFVWLVPDGFYVTDRGFVPVFKSTVGFIQDVSVVPKWLWNNTMDLVLGPGSSGAAVVSVRDIPYSYARTITQSIFGFNPGLLSLFEIWVYPFSGSDVDVLPVYCVSASSAIGFAVVDKVYGRIPSEYSDYELYLYDFHSDLIDNPYNPDYVGLSTTSDVCAVLIRTFISDRNARWYKTTVCYTQYVTSAVAGLTNVEYIVPQDGAYYISDVNLLNEKYLQVTLVNKTDSADVVVVSQEIIV